MGVVEHLGINALGGYVPKQILTHDLSLPGICSKESINLKVKKEKLEPIMFGYYL